MSRSLRKTLRFILFPVLGILLIFIVENPVCVSMDAGEIYNLRQSVEALNRVREQASRELAEASAAGRFSVQEQHDYRTFIAYLGGRVDEYCRTLYISGGPQAIAGLTCPGGGAGLPNPTAPAAKTMDEQIAALEASLTDSLGDFDEMLLKEQYRIAARQPRQRESGGYGGGGDFSGQGSEGTASTGEGIQDKRAGDGAAQENIPAEGAKGSGGGDQSSASTRQAGQDTLAADDDIVARQLREAAEKETDPELKKRLWEEYRKYKAGK
ncbi:MAG: hypothetical protein KAU41_03735 [Deltaproteobacteria bacterium]|nr:hypothetical protein [Deltaproteobacteria bacterium]